MIPDNIFVQLFHVLSRKKCFAFNCKTCVLGSFKGNFINSHRTISFMAATLSHCQIIFPFYLCVQQSRKSHTYSVKDKRNYYDILGITPSATQAQVKEAYYQLSMEHHPDQNKGCSVSSEKFRSITEAYEILGNYYKRKLYDKGFFGVAHDVHQEEAREYSLRAYNSKARQRNVPHFGRTQIYNFDEWSQAHYSATFQRRNSARMEHEMSKEMNEDKKKSSSDKFALVAVSLILFYIVFHLLISYGNTNYDIKKEK